MIAAAFALLILQQAAPTVVWYAPAPEAVVETPAPPFEHNVPAWGLADPFGFERARCSPLVRGQKSMAECQTEVRDQLAIAMGSDLPEALRPSGMAGDCQMIRASEQARTMRSSAAGSLARRPRPRACEKWIVVRVRSRAGSALSAARSMEPTRRGCR